MTVAPNGNVYACVYSGDIYLSTTIVGNVTTNAITDVQVNTNNKDGLATTPSLRTLGTGSQQAVSGTDTRFGITGVTPLAYGQTWVGNSSNIATLASYIYPSYVNGLGLSYSTATTILVNAGTCTDSTNVATITLASPVTIPAPITITLNGVAGGNDSFQGPGTAVAATGTVTGTGTTFTTSFGTKVGTGTISSSAAVVTGVNTFFTSQVTIGDLIGNTTSGYFQVIAIASDASLTIVSTPATPFVASSTFNVIENPTIQVGAGISIQVKTIASNTVLTTTAATYTVASNTYRIGVPASSTTQPHGSSGANMQWLYVFVSTSLSVYGTAYFVSTQRTTPFGLVNYNTYFRRIGSVLINAGAIDAFSQWGNYNDRYYQWELAGGVATTELRVLASGSATASWTAIPCNSAASAFAQNIYFIYISTGTTIYVRRRGTGATTLTRNNRTNTSTGFQNPMQCPCDGAQCIDYVLNAADATTIDVTGFMEEL
jgi:hypothetical protein